MRTIHRHFCRYSCGFVFLLAIALSGCGAGGSKPSAESAKTFLDDAEKKMNDLSLESAQASWVQSTYITQDTEALSALASQRAIDYGVQLAKEAAKYDGVELPAETRRKMDLLKRGLTLAAPSDPAESKEVTKIAASLEATYGKGKYCKTPDKCLDIDQITEIMKTSRNADELLDVWKGWHTISPPMKKDFQRFVELSNKGAKELGF